MNYFEEIIFIKPKIINIVKEDKTSELGEKPFYIGFALFVIYSQDHQIFNWWWNVRSVKVVIL